MATELLSTHQGFVARVELPFIERMLQGVDAADVDLPGKQSFRQRPRDWAAGGEAAGICEPANGSSAENHNPVLITLHDGDFIIGFGGVGGAIESIPLAATGRIMVISADYRLTPEHRFPSESENVPRSIANCSRRTGRKISGSSTAARTAWWPGNRIASRSS